MNPQQNTPLDPFTEPATTPQQVTGQPVAPTATPVATEKPKKSHKSTIILLLIGLVLIIGAIGAYAYYMQATTPASDLTNKNVTSPVEKPSDVEATTELMTDGTNEETKLGETSDEAEVNDADKAAGTVGESVNENNL